MRLHVLHYRCTLALLQLLWMHCGALNLWRRKCVSRLLGLEVGKHPGTERGLAQMAPSCHPLGTKEILLLSQWGGGRRGEEAVFAAAFWPHSSALSSQGWPWVNESELRKQTRLHMQGDRMARYVTLVNLSMKSVNWHAFPRMLFRESLSSPSVLEHRHWRT